MIARRECGIRACIASWSSTGVTASCRPHTSSVGTDEYNMALSQRRAETVMNYLKEHGVTNRMTAKGYGPEDPLADNSTADGRQQNRRVQFVIIEKK